MNGYISEESLATYSKLVAEKLDQNFSEGDTYDFTRCVRPNGSAYGTGGRCRKGTEEAKSPNVDNDAEYKKLIQEAEELEEAARGFFDKGFPETATRVSKTAASLRKKAKALQGGTTTASPLKPISQGAKVPQKKEPAIDDSLNKLKEKVAAKVASKAQIKELETKAQAEEEFEIVQEKRNKRQLAANLDEKAKIAIRDYTDSYFKYGRSYESLNVCLRFPPNCKDSETQQKFAKEMDTALSKLPKNDDGDEFFRSVTANPGPVKVLYDQLKKAKPGMRIKDPGFGSYSSSREQAEYFSSESDLKERIIFISRNKNLTPINMYSEWEEENEAVLPRGIEQTIRKVTQDGETLIVEID